MSKTFYKTNSSVQDFDNLFSKKHTYNMTGSGIKKQYEMTNNGYRTSQIKNVPSMSFNNIPYPSQKECTGKIVNYDVSHLKKKNTIISDRFMITPNGETHRVNEKKIRHEDPQIYVKGEDGSIKRQISRNVNCIYDKSRSVSPNNYKSNIIVQNIKKSEPISQNNFNTFKPLLKTSSVTSHQQYPKNFYSSKPLLKTNSVASYQQYPKDFYSQKIANMKNELSQNEKETIKQDPVRNGFNQCLYSSLRISIRYNIIISIFYE